MRRLAAMAVFIGLTCAAEAAHASLISPIDPVIGVRGDRAGSPDATDGSIYPLSPCTAEELAGYFCASYSNNVGTITSIDLSFWDVDGLPIPNLIFDGEFGGPNYFAAPESDFQGLLNGNDLFTVRLCDTQTADGLSACGLSDEIFSILLAIDPETTSFFVFSDVDGFVSVRAVNTIANLNLPANNVPIPEPGMLALFAVAAGFTWRRRLGRHTA